MKNRERSLHHRKPKARGGTNHPKNISNVPKSQHRAWHTLFGDRRPEDITNFINEVWIDPDYMLVCVNRKDFQEGRYHW
jgi:hypothetical protein